MTLLVVAGCAHPTVPPAARPAADPIAHGIHLVAFREDGSGYLVMERIVRESTRLTLYGVDSQTGDRALIGNLDSDVERLLALAWPGDRGLIPTLRPSSTGAKIIEELGYEWPSRAEGAALETEYGVLMLEDARVVLRHDGDEVTVAELAPGVDITRSAWLVSLEGTLIGLTVDYAGRPRVVDLRVINVKEAAARILSKRGFQAHVEHRYDIAAVLWRRARELDPSAPDVSYNLACAEALLGRPQPALERLREAIDLGGDRYRNLARDDDDLLSLAGRLEFLEILKRPVTPAAN